MATRLKTVQYAFPVLATLANNTLTNVPQITVYLPESGTKTIRKAWVDVSLDENTTGGGNFTTKTVNLRLGAAAYTSTTNANSLANTGENFSFFCTRDFTSHFVANWSGTSMTCDVQLQINQASGLGLTNVCVMLYVTYEYDDTSTTQLKTVLIPLDGPDAALPTGKTSYDTFPELDTYLPEASKVYRNISVVFLANTAKQSFAVDFTLSFELSSLGVHTTQLYEQALLSDRFVRYIWEITSYVTTNVSHTFNMWASQVDACDAPMAYAVVTYEFNASTTTSVMNSLQLPMEIDSPMGGTAAADFQRSDREFWVQEINPVRQRLAFYLYLQATGNPSINLRVGTGSFVAKTISGSQAYCGNICAMERNDSPTGISFARGRNNLQFDIYGTTALQRGGNLSGFWLLNYTSDKHADGVGAHNHTVMFPVFTQGTTTSALQEISASGAIAIPETNYFLTAVGFWLNLMQGGAAQGVSVKAERTVAEGGLIFERIYADVTAYDNELGAFDTWIQARTLFKRWSGDPGPGRLDIETARRYVMNSSSVAAWFNHLIKIVTYHTISYDVAGEVADSNGGTVTLGLHRADTGEKVLETSRVGNGAYSFTWFDNTEEVFVSAYEDDTYKGRSGNGLAT